MSIYFKKSECCAAYCSHISILQRTIFIMWVYQLGVINVNIYRPCSAAFFNLLTPLARRKWDKYIPDRLTAKTKR